MPENPYILGAMLQEDPLLISPSLVEAIYFRLLKEMKTKENDYIRYDPSATGYPEYQSFVLAMVLEVLYRTYSMKGFVQGDERAFLTNRQEIAQEVPILENWTVKAALTLLEKLGYISIYIEEWFSEVDKEMEDYRELRIVINFDNIRKDVSKLRYRRTLNMEQMKKNIYYKRRILDAKLKKMRQIKWKLPESIQKGGNLNGKKSGRKKGRREKDDNKSP